MPGDVEAEQWVLAEPESSVSVGADAHVTLGVEDDTVSGSAPCNSYRGPIRIDGDHVEIGPLATTLRGCPDRLMRADDEYLAALEAADTIDVSVDRLILSNDRGVRLVFRPFEIRRHLVGRWSITSVNTGDAIVSPVVGTDPTVTFADDGTLQVETGCNTGAGAWKLLGNELAAGPIALTRRACIEPEGIEEQEDAIVRALDGVTIVQVTPEQLTLLHPRGTIALMATR